MKCKCFYTDIAVFAAVLSAGLLSGSLLGTQVGLSAAAQQVLPSLYVNQDARSQAMGSVNVMLESSGNRMDYNVASMALGEEKLSAGVSYGLWQPGYGRNNLVGVGVSYRFGKWGVGASFKSMTYQKYSLVTGTGNTLRDSEFTPLEYNVGVGAAYAVTDYLSVGLTAKLAHSSIAPENVANVFGADVGLYFNLKGVSAGLALSNIGPRVRYGSAAYAQPMVLKGGAAYSFAFGGSQFTAAAQFDVLSFKTCMAGVGLEYSYSDSYFVRCGYHYGNKKKAVPSHGAVGIGFKFFGVSLDASYLISSGPVKNSFALGLGYSF